ncbi:uracil-DNA glycosylase [Oleiagrimonas sp.]|jgi:uracil-DNA glycosylase|uniref:uracil-DNA glycosylase n=1 Tax=Oleiagrimonas sp. TaxID=2010330 RepID=UPI002616162A|nr:uracil-DNA glycosylase [Oleiagrimonas sp.]MDA3914161.1 uracil-DNA glycosylase [Oleiagrimonas sp.]
MAGHPLHLEASWKDRVGDYFERKDMRELADFLRAQKRDGKAIYPPGPEIFAAFEHTPFEQVKVVILGQDPYHGPGQAHGLCFSVRPDVPVPPSLQNIFKEIERDLGIARPDHGCLTPWADRGVLLLNTVLTVERGRAASHRGMGWEGFTDTVIRCLSEEREGLVFLLWGSHAGAKAGLIDGRRHAILRTTHPSPLSAHRGFLGCGHFSQTQAFLQARGMSPLDWSLPPARTMQDWRGD